MRYRTRVIFMNQLRINLSPLEAVEKPYELFYSNVKNGLRLIQWYAIIFMHYIVVFCNILK